MNKVPQRYAFSVHPLDISHVVDVSVFVSDLSRYCERLCIDGGEQHNVLDFIETRIAQRLRSAPPWARIQASSLGLLDNILQLPHFLPQSL